MILRLKRPGFKQAILEILVSTFTCPQLGFSHHVLKLISVEAGTSKNFNINQFNQSVLPGNLT